MQDQVADLTARGYPGVAALHSNVPAQEQRDTLAALADGRLRLLYLTPERCASDDFLAVARRTRISLIAVDEAHCLSDWGHDFRPDYQLLAHAARALGRPPLLALTATATPQVREDISERLELRSPRLIVRGFDRPNLFYEVLPAGDEATEERLLTALLTAGEPAYPSLTAAAEAAASGRAIIYTGLTKTARGLAQRLNRAGVHTAYYHGQLKASQRTTIQQRFSAGDIRALVATNAFGLGIDLADLRCVVHVDPPASLEAYYQESGRAGRDGGFARCTLLFSEDDLGRAAFAAGSSVATPAELEQIVAALDEASGGLRLREVSARLGRSPAATANLLRLLVAVGVARERRGRYRLDRLASDGVARAVARDERRQAWQRTKLEMVRTYARLDSCRRQFLLHYLGEYDAPDRCDHCDRCVSSQPRAEATVAPATAARFPVGGAVTHAGWGEGVIQHVGDGRITIQFETAGYRTLDLATVLAGDLLAADPAVPAPAGRADEGLSG